MKRLLRPGLAAGLGLCLGFYLAGCASQHITPVRPWHAAPAAGTTRVVATTADAPHADYTVRLICKPDAPPASQLTLQVERAPGADHGPGPSTPATIRFGWTNPASLTWENNGAVATARMPASDLADGVAYVFRTNQPVTLTRLTAQNKPLRFTVGQGPYEPVVSHFLAHCPPTRRRMPTLVRIDNATLKPVPKSTTLPPASMKNGPRYPTKAIQEYHSGTVKLVATIAPDGDVLWPVVVQSSGYPELDVSARSFVSQWHYPPQPLGPNELYLIHQSIIFSLPGETPPRP